jgi:hypothetical protein
VTLAGDLARRALDRERTRAIVRRRLLALGGRLRPGTLADLRVVLGYLELGAWVGTPAVYPDRDALFVAAASAVRGRAPLYLEFGVYEGASLRRWAGLLDQPGARLVGFDSFEGLATDWRPGFEAGAFRVPGPPAIADPRVSFEIGMFAETLPSFAVPDHDQLIINIDCDLFASTEAALAWAEPHIRVGTIIYFDELPDRDHELRAFREHLDRTGRRVQALGIAGGGLHWLFRYLS